MSGSPKYSTPSLTAQVASELASQAAEAVRRAAEAAAERRRQAQAEAARRRAEEAREEVGRLASSVSDQVSAARSGAAAPFTDTAALEQLARRAREVAEESGFDEASARQAAKELKRVGKDVAAAVSAGERARREDERARALAAAKAEEERRRREFEAALAEESAAVAELRRSPARDATTSRKFDPEGASRVEAALSQAERLLAKESLQEARSQVASARSLCAAHEAEVERQAAQWAEQRQRAAAAVATAEATAASLAADPAAARWKPADVAAVRALARQAGDLLRAEQFAAAAARCEEQTRVATSAAGAAHESQAKEDRRQYIVGGILKVMGEMGFVVQNGSPGLEDPADARSSVLIVANRLGGGTVGVSVPQEGDVWYDVDGFPKRDEVQGERVVRTCDEAEDTIEGLHERLRDECGIDMSELMWKDKPPERIRKEAKVARRMDAKSRQA